MDDTGILDQVYKNVPWLVIPATVLTAAPKLLEVWEGFVGTHGTRKRLEIENARLENLKLLVEIEAIKKEHGIELPEEVDLPNLLTSGALAATRQGVIRHKPVEKRVWSWLERLSKKWPRVTMASTTCLSLACIWLGLFLPLVYVFSGFCVFAADDKESDALLPYLIGGFFSIVIPGLLLLKMGYSLKTQKRLLKIAAMPTGG